MNGSLICVVLGAAFIWWEIRACRLVLLRIATIVELSNQKLEEIRLKMPDRTPREIPDWLTNGTK